MLEGLLFLEQVKNTHFMTEKYFFTIQHFFYNSEDYVANFFSKNIMFKNRIPGNMCAIASSPSGNLFLLSVKGDDYGKVYFWDHEMETEPADYSNLTLIADSFDEFINNLKSEEEIEDLLNEK